MRPLAKKYEEYLNFVIVDAEEYPDMGPILGIRGSGLSVQNTANGDIFPYPDNTEISPNNVDSFIMDISNGAVRPWDGKQKTDVSQHDEL